jgi:hypothetical protein
MPRVLRRETFIALRARRQAHRIASDILHPELNVEPPAEPHHVWDNPDLGPLVRSVRYRPGHDRLMLAFALLVWAGVIAVICLLIWGG